MEYQCKFCDKREGEPQGWLLVFEFTKPGTDLRNTIFFIDQWDEKIARRANAVHFCSKACREKYLARKHEQLAA
ncbi:MAG TPA: hypothetical protein VEV41_03190 [Terriglobales bacterium]|nr:hypothetical protein [Terriglobales bacterium]